MLPNVYSMELDAWIARGDSKDAILVGEKALELTPGNAELMSVVAYLIADTSSDPASLNHSRILATGALETINRIQIPRTISPEEWKSIRGSLDSKAHSALGLVAFKEGHLAQSITQFEAALQLGTSDESAIFLRLGHLYLLVGQREKARSALTQAAASSDPELRRLAEQELAKVPSPQKHP